MYFGVISPKIKTTTVIAAVETTEEFKCEFTRRIAKKSVLKVEAEIFTILFPIRIVLKSLS